MLCALAVMLTVKQCSGANKHDGFCVSDDDYYENGGARGGYVRHRSRSPMSHRRRHVGDRVSSRNIRCSVISMRIWHVGVVTVHAESSAIK